jgi:hypothetical protein
MQEAESAPIAGAPLQRWGLAAAAALLLAGIAALMLDTGTREAIPQPPSGHVVFIDVEGWYRRTPDEVAARSPFDLSLSALPDSLPLSLGRWIGEDRPHDPEVDLWLREPEVSIERTYREPGGGIIWMSAFGSSGTKSFHLFEHTPETCYPLGGWEVDEFRRVGLPLGPRRMTVNHGRAHLQDREMLFAYFYVWDTPARDPERGVLSIRLAAPVLESPEATWALLAEDFIPEIFPATLGWRRF